MSFTNSIIKVEGLGKSYRILHERAEPYTALRDVIANSVKGALKFRRRGPSDTPTIEDFWALKDVSFEVAPGEVLGIIGRNGAGKSTLLKILSRITEPTRGRVTLRGRVASLLEIGTGFHPELTGRENITLNGAILGMTRAEIRAKFDEIVAFAEIERFLDTPVKRYSSGMYVRLAFAVAAHLDPEILIVDEVLAVGDADFQQKCLGKMEAVASEKGRTVLFVSHNMESIMRLCGRALLLQSGQLAAIGDAHAIVQQYLERVLPSSEVVRFDRASRPEHFDGRLVMRRAEAPEGRPGFHYDFGEPIVFDLIIEAAQAYEDVELVTAVASAKGFEVLSWSTRCTSDALPILPGINRVRIQLDAHLLPGWYKLRLGLRSKRGLEDHLPEAMDIEVRTNALAAKIGADTFQGIVVPEGRFSVVDATAAADLGGR